MEVGNEDVRADERLHQPDQASCHVGSELQVVGQADIDVVEIYVIAEEGQRFIDAPLARCDMIRNLIFRRRGIVLQLSVVISDGSTRKTPPLA